MIEMHKSVPSEPGGWGPKMLCFECLLAIGLVILMSTHIMNFNADVSAIIS